MNLSSSGIAAKLVMLYDESEEFVEIWTVVGSPKILSVGVQSNLSYPGTHITNYVALPIEPVAEDYWMLRIKSEGIREILPKPMRPLATTWAHIVE